MQQPDISRATDDVAADVRVRTLCTADRVLAAREALKSEPDENVREEFERLLQEA